MGFWHDDFMMVYVFRQYPVQSESWGEGCLPRCMQIQQVMVCGMRLDKGSEDGGIVYCILQSLLQTVKPNIEMLGNSTDCSASQHVNWFAGCLQRFHAFPLTFHFPDRFWKSLMHVKDTSGGSLSAYICIHTATMGVRSDNDLAPRYDMFDRLCTLYFSQPFVKSLFELVEQPLSS